MGDQGLGVAIDDHIPLSDGGELVVGHVLRSSVKVGSIAAPGWADSTGDVVVGRLLRPAKVEGTPRPRNSATPRLVPRSGRWSLHVPGEGEGWCRWVEPSGRLGASIPLVDGEAMLARPSSAGLRHLQVERGGMRWILAVPSVR